MSDLLLERAALVPSIATERKRTVGTEESEGGAPSEASQTISRTLTDVFPLANTASKESGNEASSDTIGTRYMTENEVSSLVHNALRRARQATNSVSPRRRTMKNYRPTTREEKKFDPETGSDVLSASSMASVGSSGIGIPTSPYASRIPSPTKTSSYASQIIQSDSKSSINKDQIPSLGSKSYTNSKSSESLDIDIGSPGVDDFSISIASTDNDAMDHIDAMDQLLSPSADFEDEFDGSGDESSYFAQTFSSVNSSDAIIRRVEEEIAIARRAAQDANRRLADVSSSWEIRGLKTPTSPLGPLTSNSSSKMSTVGSTSKDFEEVEQDGMHELLSISDCDPNDETYDSAMDVIGEEFGVGGGNENRGDQPAASPPVTKLWSPKDPEAKPKRQAAHDTLTIEVVYDPVAAPVSGDDEQEKPDTSDDQEAPSKPDDQSPVSQKDNQEHDFSVISPKATDDTAGSLPSLNTVPTADDEKNAPSEMKPEEEAIERSESSGIPHPESKDSTSKQRELNVTLGSHSQVSDAEGDQWIDARTKSSRDDDENDNQSTEEQPETQDALKKFAMAWGVSTSLGSEGQAIHVEEEEEEEEDIAGKDASHPIVLDAMSNSEEHDDTNAGDAPNTEFDHQVAALYETAVDIDCNVAIEPKQDNPEKTDENKGSDQKVDEVAIGSEVGEASGKVSNNLADSDVVAVVVDEHLNTSRSHDSHIDVQNSGNNEDESQISMGVSFTSAMPSVTGSRSNDQSVEVSMSRESDKVPDSLKEKSPSWEKHQVETKKDNASSETESRSFLPAPPSISASNSTATMSADATRDSVSYEDSNTVEVNDTMDSKENEKQTMVKESEKTASPENVTRPPKIDTSSPSIASPTEKSLSPKKTLWWNKNDSLNTSNEKATIDVTKSNSIASDPEYSRKNGVTGPDPAHGRNSPPSTPLPHKGQTQQKTGRSLPPAPRSPSPSAHKPPTSVSGSNDYAAKKAALVEQRRAARSRSNTARAAIGGGVGGAEHKGYSDASKSKKVRFRQRYPVPPLITKPRAPSEIIAENALGQPQYSLHLAKPKKDLQQLLSAATDKSLARRANACGALKVLTTKPKNMLTLVRTAGFLEALVFAAETDINPLEREIAIDARTRAVSAILNVCKPKDNRVLVFSHTRLPQCLVKCIIEDDNEARTAACGALATLVKSPECREGLAKVNRLIDALSCIAVGKRDLSNFEAVQRSFSGEEEGRLFLEKSPSSEGSATSSLGENSSKSGNRDPLAVHHLPHINSIRQQKLDNSDELFKRSRISSCAALLHFSKHCAVSDQLCSNSIFMDSIIAITREYHNPLHTKCLEILCNLTRFPANNALLAKYPGLVDTLVASGRAKTDEDRVWALRALQNLSSDVAGKSVLANALVLELLSVSVMRTHHDEQYAATATLYNLSTEPGAVVPLTNTKNVVATLVHIAHAQETATDIRLMACDALATLGLWLQTLAGAGTVPDDVQPVPLPSYATQGWQRWD